MLQRSSEKGNQRPENGGKNAGKCQISYHGDWVWVHVIWGNINPRPTNSARAHRILKFGIYRADMGQDTAIHTFLSYFSSFWMVVSCNFSLIKIITKHRYLVNLAVIFLFTSPVLWYEIQQCSHFKISESNRGRGGGGGHAPISQKDTGVGWPTIEKSCTQHSQNDFWLAAHTLFATWTKWKKCDCRLCSCTGVSPPCSCLNSG